MLEKGEFVMVSSEELEIKDVIPMYYTRLAAENNSKSTVLGVLAEMGNLMSKSYGAKFGLLRIRTVL